MSFFFWEETIEEVNGFSGKERRVGKAWKERLSFWEERRVGKGREGAIGDRDLYVTEHLGAHFGSFKKGQMGWDGYGHMDIRIYEINEINE
jgi:hypothetical protein